MSSIAEALRSVFPGFHKARRERNRIRNRYRENLKAIERGDRVYLINTRDFNPEYLQNWVQKRQSHADHLIQVHGSASGTYSYQVDRDSDEVVTAIKRAIRGIRAQNIMSLLVESVLIIFIVFVIGLAIFFGLAGISKTGGQSLNASM